jgi:hypothetical protein
VSKEQAQRRRGGFRTARGKRVPVVEINVQIVLILKNCRQTLFEKGFLFGVLLEVKNNLTRQLLVIHLTRNFWFTVMVY